ncbi:MAG TPA: hypothetical protein VIX39_06775 [Actinomycetota bacterium]
MSDPIRAPPVQHVQGPHRGAGTHHARALPAGAGTDRRQHHERAAAEGDGGPRPKGRPDPRAKANEKARELLATHEPVPLPEGMEAELDAIMETYEAQSLADAR